MRAALALAAALWPGLAEAACRLALLLALDVSGSVDEREYDLQLEGLASALGDEEVRRVLFAMPGAPVALSVFEWSSASYQSVIQDWVMIEDDATLDALRNRLLGWSRAPAPEATGLGAALEYARGRFRTAPDCWDETLDISADGKNNDWPPPERLRASGRLGEMNVNALVVAPDFLVTYDTGGTGIAELAAYFKAQIIHGPGAFVEVALGYSDYADAMRRKLLRELAALPIGQAPTRAPFRIVDNAQ